MLYGCGQPGLLNETIPVDNQAWAHSVTAAFQKEVNDIQTPYNYFIQVRHGGDFRYQNLIVFFKTYRPNNTYTVDTVDCPLASKEGKWYGSGIGDILDNQVLFKINQRFSQTGVYKFEIQHAMRPDTIHEIYDIGLRISEASE